MILKENMKRSELDLLISKSVNDKEGDKIKDFLD